MAKLHAHKWREHDRRVSIHGDIYVLTLWHGDLPRTDIRIMRRLKGRSNWSEVRLIWGSTIEDWERFCSEFKLKKVDSNPFPSDRKER